MLRALVDRHVETGAWVTELEGLPAPLSAHICDRPMIDLLSAMPVIPGVADDPKAVLDRLYRALSGNAAPGFRVARLSIFTDCGLTPTEVPKHIPWSAGENLRDIEAAVLDPHLTKPGERLRKLRQIIVERLESGYCTSRRTATRSSESPTILYASAPSGYSGAEQCLINTITSLQGCVKGIHALVGREGVFTSRLRSCGVTVHCPELDFSRPTAKSILMIDDLIEAIRPDIIHCNAIVGPPLLAAARRRGIPLVQWVRFADFGEFEEHLVCADRITAVSRFISGEVSKQMVRAEKIRVVYDGVDCDRHSPVSRSPRDIRAELGISKGEFVILCIARFVRYKRHDVLLDAVSRAAKRHSNVRLILIGEPDRSDSTFEACVRALAETGLAARTTVLGFQPDVLPYELAADVVVLCSEREPLGTVVLECMSLAKPIVVAASGGLPEMVQDGYTGLHCIPGDANSLCEQICRLIEDSGLAQALGRQARQEALARFSLSVHANSLLSVYRELDADV
jgi:glycosyltransferase involved in cell wall biosynthesis